MTYNEAETRFYLIDLVLRSKGNDEYWKLRLETPAPVEATGNKGRRRVGGGRTDYLRQLITIDLRILFCTKDCCRHYPGPDILFLEACWNRTFD